jgi:excisionase family DNA binding protein
MPSGPAVAPKQNKTLGAAKRRKRAGVARPPVGCAAEDSALTTGEAARYCFVSAGSVVNWIAAGSLVAQRTAGGQFRIRVADLRAFMRAHAMRTDALDANFPPCASCWAYWAVEAPASSSGALARACADCPVYRARAAVCNEIRPLLPGAPSPAQSCADCEYRKLRDRIEAAEREAKT